MRTTSVILGILFVLFGCSDGNRKSDAYGNFETVDVLVASEIQGRLLQFDVQEGMNLKSGEQVGLIDTVQLALKRDQLIAQRNATSARLAGIVAQIDVQEAQKKTLMVDQVRIEKLVKDHATPTKQLDDINGKIDVVNSEIASIKTQNTSVKDEVTALNKQIDQILDQLRRCRIINPIHGTVLEKYMEPSEIAVPGKVLYKIANLDTMILRVYISGAQLSSVKLGQKVTVLIDKDEDHLDTLRGTIGWISSQAEFTPKIIQTRDERVNLVYAMKVYIKNNGELKIGMPGEIRF